MYPGLILIGLAAAGAATNTSDWRLVTIAGTAAAIFVDVANIAPTPDNHREAEEFYVLTADTPEGVAAARIRVDIDCAGHRQRHLHIQSLNVSNGVIADSDVTEGWAPDTPGTSAEPIEKYICSGGASDPAAASAGSSMPISGIRAILNKPRTDK